MLFIRGNAMSAASSIKGTNQFPNPPIRIDTTKIVTKAWAVTTTLQIWSTPFKDPGCPISFRISGIHVGLSYQDRKLVTGQNTVYFSIETSRREVLSLLLSFFV